MTTERIDVLAVMDRLLECVSVGVDADDPVRQLIESGHEARAAIAELIEADREFEAADAAWGGKRYERDDYGVYGSDFWRCLDCEGESDAGMLNKGVTHEPGCRVEALERAVKRRAAALARVGAP